MRSIPMLWDPSFDSWRFYEVFGQPAYALLTREGKEVKRWSGYLDVEEMLDLASRI